MNLNSEQQEFVEQVSRLWADGLTQQQIADTLAKSLSTVRGRLAYYGLKFGRNGKIVPIREAGREAA